MPENTLPHQSPAISSNHSRIGNTSQLSTHSSISSSKHGDQATVLTVQNTLLPLSTGRKYVEIKLLTGERLFLVVGVKRCTVGHIDLHLSKCLNVENPYLFGLAQLVDNEYRFLNDATKLVKCAAKSWKTSVGWGTDINGNPLLVLYYRIQIYVNYVQLLTGPVSLHHYYLQLRQNILNQWDAQALLEERAFELAALALQIDFGNYADAKRDKEYFNPSAYFPLRVVTARGLDYLRRHTPSLHADLVGWDPERAKRLFVDEICSSGSSLNCHTYGLRSDKALNAPECTLLGIGMQGLELYEVSDIVKQQIAAFAWPQIAKVAFERRKFSISGLDGHRFTFYAKTEEKAKYLLAFCQQVHQLVMRLQPLIAKAQKCCDTVAAGDASFARELCVDGRYGGAAMQDTGTMTGPGSSPDDIQSFSPLIPPLGLDFFGQRVSVVSNASSNTTSGIVSDKQQIQEVESEMDAEESDPEANIVDSALSLNGPYAASSCTTSFRGSTGVLPGLEPGSVGSNLATSIIVTGPIDRVSKSYVTNGRFIGSHQSGKLDENNNNLRVGYEDSVNQTPSLTDDARSEATTGTVNRIDDLVDAWGDNSTLYQSEHDRCSSAGYSGLEETVRRKASEAAMSAKTFSINASSVAISQQPNIKHDTKEATATPSRPASVSVITVGRSNTTAGSYRHGASLSSTSNDESQRVQTSFNQPDYHPRPKSSASPTLVLVNPSCEDDVSNDVSGEATPTDRRTDRLKQTSVGLTHQLIAYDTGIKRSPATSEPRLSFSEMSFQPSTDGDPVLSQASFDDMFSAKSGGKHLVVAKSPRKLPRSQLTRIMKSLATQTGASLGRRMRGLTLLGTSPGASPTTIASTGPLQVGLYPKAVAEKGVGSITSGLGSAMTGIHRAGQFAAPAQDGSSRLIGNAVDQSRSIATRSDQPACSTAMMAELDLGDRQRIPQPHDMRKFHLQDLFRPDTHTIHTHVGKHAHGQHWRLKQHQQQQQQQQQRQLSAMQLKSLCDENGQPVGPSCSALQKQPVALSSSLNEMQHTLQQQFLQQQQQQLLQQQHQQQHHDRLWQRRTTLSGAEDTVTAPCGDAALPSYTGSRVTLAGVPIEHAVAAPPSNNACNNYNYANEVAVPEHLLTSAVSEPGGLHQQSMPDISHDIVVRSLVQLTASPQNIPHQQQQQQQYQEHISQQQQQLKRFQEYNQMYTSGDITQSRVDATGNQYREGSASLVAGPVGPGDPAVSVRTAPYVQQMRQIGAGVLRQPAEIPLKRDNRTPRIQMSEAKPQYRSQGYLADASAAGILRDLLPELQSAAAGRGLSAELSEKLSRLVQLEQQQQQQQQRQFQHRELRLSASNLQHQQRQQQAYKQHVGARPQQPQSSSYTSLVNAPHAHPNMLPEMSLPELTGKFLSQPPPSYSSVFGGGAPVVFASGEQPPTNSVNPLLRDGRLIPKCSSALELGPTGSVGDVAMRPREHSFDPRGAPPSPTHRWAEAVTSGDTTLIEYLKRTLQAGLNPQTGLVSTAEVQSASYLPFSDIASSNVPHDAIQPQQPRMPQSYPTGGSESHLPLLHHNLPYFRSRVNC